MQTLRDLVNSQNQVQSQATILMRINSKDTYNNAINTGQSIISGQHNQR